VLPAAFVVIHLDDLNAVTLEEYILGLVVVGVSAVLDFSSQQTFIGIGEHGDSVILVHPYRLTHVLGVLPILAA